MTDDMKAQIVELSRLNKIDIHELLQLKSAKAIEKAADDPSGTAGAGMGMGMGFAMANQMGNTMQANSASNATPPPLPNDKTWHIAVDGSQQGPFSIGDLKPLAESKKLNHNTLVWKEGMANWQKASELTELKPILGSIPPPLPQ